MRPDRIRLSNRGPEAAVTAAGFWQGANAWSNAHGISVERALTDNGSCYFCNHHQAHGDRLSCR